MKLYVVEAESKAVEAFVKTLPPPLAFSHLHDLEIKNGLRLKLFRREAAKKSVEASIQLIERDLSTGVLQRPDLNWFDVFRKAESLSEDYTASGSRSLDLLHVACALLLKNRDFLTFDERQATLARKAGLNIVALPR